MFENPFGFGSDRLDVTGDGFVRDGVVPLADLGSDRDVFQELAARSGGAIGEAEFSVLDRAWDEVQATLSGLKSREDVDEIVGVAFGVSAAEPEVADLLTGYSLGDFSDSPGLEVLVGGELGSAWGAYAAETDTVYLPIEVLQSGDVDLAADVLLEEFGHGLDARWNVVDSPGDEGDLFSTLLQDQEISVNQKQENDFWEAPLADGAVQIELSQTNVKEDLNFFASGVEGWDALESINLGSLAGEEIRYDLFPVQEQQPQNSIENLGPLSWNLDSGGSRIESFFFVNRGVDLGESSFSYPLELDVSVPAYLGDSGTFLAQADGTSSQASSGFSSQFSQTLGLPNAGFKFIADVKPSSLKDFQISGISDEMNESLKTISVPLPAVNTQVSFDFLSFDGLRTGNQFLQGFLKAPTFPPIKNEGSSAFTNSQLPILSATSQTDQFAGFSFDLDAIIMNLVPQYRALQAGANAASILGDIELSGLGGSIKFPSDVKAKREVEGASQQLQESSLQTQAARDNLNRVKAEAETNGEPDQRNQVIISAAQDDLNSATLSEAGAEDAFQRAQDNLNIQTEESSKFLGPELKLDFDILDIKANLGATLKQDFKFTPSDVNVTLSSEDGLIDGLSESSKSLGEIFDITPPDGSGVMEINARYKLSGAVDNDLSAVLQGVLDTKVLSIDTSLTLAKFKVFNAKAVLANPKPTLNSPEIVLLDSTPLDVGALSLPELPDDSSISKSPGKNLIIERTYSIPYGLPIEVSNSSSEEGEKMEFTISLREPLDVPYTVTYSTQLLGNSSASSGDLSTIEGASLTFAPGETEKIVEVLTTEDEIRESSETFELAVAPTSGDPVFQQGNVTVDAVTGIGTIIDDEEPKPEPPRDGVGNTHNDPRLGTFDGFGYSFQAVGEFTLVESKTDDFLIQTRQSPASPNSSSVSNNSAVATRLGGQRVGIYVGTETPLLVNGQPTPIPDNGSIAVGDGRVFRDGNTYTVVYGTGEQLEAKVVGSSRIDVKTFLDEDRAGDVRGLLGNSNDDRSDDFALRNGTILTSPIPEGQLYTEFANEWRIDQKDSLFDYAEGDDTNTFTDLTFPDGLIGVDDLDPEVVALAEALLDEAGLTDPILRANTIVDLVLTRAEDGTFDLTLIETALSIEPPAEALIIGVAPEANNDFVTTNINLETPIDVLENDTGTLTIPLSIAQFDFTSTQGGSISFNDAGTPDDTTDDFLVYTPPTNFTGEDSFNYVLSDGTQTANASVTVQVDRLSLAQLDGQNGFKLNGADAGDLSGLSVSDVGDINNDGFDDIAVGALTADPGDRSAAGQTYIVYGHNNGFSAELDLNSLDGTNGFVLNGVNAEDLAGGAISAVGDLNGDGIDDIAIGASGAAPGGLDDAGLVHVVYGGGDFGASFDLANLNGQNGFTVSGSNEFDYVGLAISGGGDVNDDGVDDLIVSAPGGFGEAQNKTYVIYGQQGGLGATLNVSNINGSNGFTIVDNNGNSGLSVSSAGDFNGDGMTDIAIGTDSTNPDNTAADETYIVFGSEDMGGTFDLASLDGTNGVTLSGFDVPNFLGTTVDDAGDVNGDGFNDLIVGAFGADDEGNSAAGKTYVLFGTDLQLPDRIDVSQLDGFNGFIIEGANDGDFSGVSVSSAGDINGDGMSDLLVGASEVDASGQANSGQVSVLFGQSRRRSRNLTTSELNGSNGFTIDGVTTDALTGTAVSSAGDINGDGFDDILIGAPGNFFNDAPGESYVVLGRSAFGATAEDEPDSPESQEAGDRADFLALYGLSAFFSTTAN